VRFQEDRDLRFVRSIGGGDRRHQLEQFVGIGAINSLSFKPRNATALMRPARLLPSTNGWFRTLWNKQAAAISG
jgi:hypothetical protein